MKTDDKVAVNREGGNEFWMSKCCCLSSKSDLFSSRDKTVLYGKMDGQTDRQREREREREAPFNYLSTVPGLQRQVLSALHKHT